MNEPIAASVEPNYPLRLEVDHQDEYRRFMPLVKWLLAIPHYIVLFVLVIGAFFALIAAFFAVLITGRYPRGLWNYLTGVMRWGARVRSYLFLLVDPYPPFSLEHEPDYPVRLLVDYPEDGVSRWRALFAWLLAIPYLIVAGILNYLAQVLVFFGFFTILFAKKFPKGMFDIVVVSERWQLRGYAYALYLVTRYPPWVWE
jgi:hypothetical protein